MRKILLGAALLAAAACSKSAPSAKPDEAKIPTLTVDQVDQELAAGKAVAIDCNGEATRKKLGVVPGAVLLSDDDSFQPSELPADKTKELVFYCANTECGASHHAASKALLAGYTKVEVMPDGIAGWVKAGKKTQSL